MKKLLVVAAALAAIPSAALACSCISTDDPAELRALAPDTARNAVALVEVETTLAFSQSNGAGDRMRVVRQIAGSAPAEFRVERGPLPSSASCDQLYERGQRAVVLLYAPTAPSSGEAKYRISGLCTVHLLEKPAFHDEVARIITAKSSAERG